MNDNIFDAIKELDEALKIRKPKREVNKTKGEKLNVTVKQLTLLNEDVEEKRCDIFIDFFYINEEGDFNEAEVLIAVKELEDDIYDMNVSAYYSIGKEVVLRVDIIKYIDAVLKNPTIPVVHKAMLKAYREKVLEGEVF